MLDAKLNVYWIPYQEQNCWIDNLSKGPSIRLIDSSKDLILLDLIESHGESHWNKDNNVIYLPNQPA